MTVGQMQTENKIYSDIRRYASESTPLNRFKREMELAYGKDRFWQVLEELNENGEITIKTVKGYGKNRYEVILLLKSTPNNSAYSLSILSGDEVQRVTIKKESVIKDIPKLICAYFGLDESEVKTKNRKRELVKVRQLCMYFQKLFIPNASLKTVGIYWNRDHSTIIHARQTVQDLCDTDKQYKADFDNIKRLIISKL